MPMWLFRWLAFGDISEHSTLDYAPGIRALVGLFLAAGPFRGAGFVWRRIMVAGFAAGQA